MLVTLERKQSVRPSLWVPPSQSGLTSPLSYSLPSCIESDLPYTGAVQSPAIGSAASLAESREGDFREGVGTPGEGTNGADSIVSDGGSVNEGESVRESSSAGESAFESGVEMDEVGMASKPEADELARSRAGVCTASAEDFFGVSGAGGGCPPFSIGSRRPSTSETETGVLASWRGVSSGGCGGGADSSAGSSSV